MIKLRERIRETLLMYVAFMYKENVTEEKPALIDMIILPKRIFSQCKKVMANLKIESKTDLMEVTINWQKR